MQGWIARFGVEFELRAVNNMRSERSEGCLRVVALPVPNVIVNVSLVACASDALPFKASSAPNV